MTENPRFKDFFKSEEVRALLPAQAQAIVACVAEVSAPVLAGLGASEGKQDEFARKVSELSVSGSFISEFSDELGTPLPEETEEAFVRRAKTVLRETLRSKFRSW